MEGPPTPDIVSEKPLDMRHLRADIWNALNQGGLSALSVVQNKYTEEHPNDREYITALFELPRFYDTQARLGEIKQKMEELKQEKMFGAEYQKMKEQKLECFRELTEYQFLLTHLIGTHPEDREYLQSFWESAMDVSRAGAHKSDLLRLRNGVLSQVATMHILDSLGMDTHISHPDIDAFHAIDIEADDGSLWQVKGSPSGDIEVLATSDIGPTNVRIDRGENTQHFSAYAFEEMRYFSTKVADYEKITGKPAEGYLIVLPYKEFDIVTGKPSAFAISEVSNKIKTHVE